MGIQIRNYREQDLDLIAVLSNAIEAFEHANEGATVEEVREEFERADFNPEENAFVAQDEGGRIVAVASLHLAQEPAESGFRCWFKVHPMQRGRGLEDRLVARLFQRAEERMGEVEASRPVYISCIANLFHPERIAALERAGLKEIRRTWTMVRPGLEDLPAPRYPPGFIVRAMQLGQDDVESLDASNAAFQDHFGYTEDSMERWQQFLHSPRYRPDLTVLAVDPQFDKIAGFCHIMINEGECERLGVQRGWIEILGVRREYRRRGLGEALILEGMRNLKQEGMEQAVLGCDSENTTGATRLYFRVGFQVEKEFVILTKYLREPRVHGEAARELAEA